MPYIKVSTTAAVTPEQCERVKAKLGKAIESFPGKTESWLMVEIEGEKRMWFRGDASADTAMVDVDLLGNVAPAASEKMTAAVCAILDAELGIPAGRIYVKYTGYQNWGWNGSNF